ncbi:MAG: hypothetical protein K2Z80_26140 [Xanthobacteraceae bacterium]|nr:hypothetical protein [Xanthobacteraceae bacterium]
MTTSPKEKTSPASALAFDVGQFGQQHVDAFAQMQQDLVNLLEEANRNWLARIEVECGSAIDLGAKLSAAKTIPDAVKAYEEWLGERLRWRTDDSRKSIADGRESADPKSGMPIELIERYLPSLVIE